MDVIQNTELMETPLKLIEWLNGIPKLNQSTAQLLSQLDTPVVVIGIAGSYRSGKSYLMNLLAGKRTGFEIGSTVESKTKGIWIWCRPHPVIADATLILMDTEGLEDISTGDDDHDMQIIVLTLLLSSMFIYNTTGKMDNNLIKQLGFVSELTNYIQVKITSDSDDTDFDLYLPTLAVTIRDFFLTLEMNGRIVTANEYFEFCLQTKEGKPGKRKTDDYNEPRLKIQKYFPSGKRFCFTLPQPVRDLSEETLKNLESLSLSEMNPKFLEKCEEYQELILKMSQKKSFGQYDRVNGRMFVDMAEAYVTAIIDDDMPCIQSALKLTALRENQRIMSECVEKYNSRIAQLNLPLTQEELTRAHENLVIELAQDCKQKIIFEESEEFREEFQGKVRLAYGRAVELNEKSSFEKCQQILRDLNNAIDTKMSNKAYLRSGGYEEYKSDLSELKVKYGAAEKKGVKSEQVLHAFLQIKESEVNSIIAIDKEITLAKANEEAEKRLREERELRQKMVQEELEQAKAREEALAKTMQETRREMEEEHKKRLAEQQQLFERMLKERPVSQPRPPSPPSCTLF